MEQKLKDQKTTHPRLREYGGERDIQNFWNAVAPSKEPSTQRWYAPILIILIIGSVPWYRDAGQMGNIVAGFPTWIWTSIFCSIGVAILTAVGVLLFWSDDDPD